MSIIYDTIIGPFFIEVWQPTNMKLCCKIRFSLRFKILLIKTI